MRKFLILSICIFLAGCNYGGEGFQTYLEDPQAFIKDPHYKHYQENKAELERQYLNEEISYVDYIQQKQEMDDNYNMEVERRRSIIESNY